VEEDAKGEEEKEVDELNIVNLSNYLKAGVPNASIAINWSIPKRSLVDSR
jgi:hypothetical protein